MRQDGPDATREVIVFEVGQRRFKVSAHCPHRGGLLRFAHVNVDKLQIRCPMHNSTFSLLTGDRVAGPRCGGIYAQELPADEDNHVERSDS